MHKYLLLLIKSWDCTIKHKVVAITLLSVNEWKILSIIHLTRKQIYLCPMHTINNDEKEMREDDIRPGPSIQNIVCVDIANVISRVWLILSLSQNTICACYNMNVTCMITSDIIHCFINSNRMQWPIIEKLLCTIYLNSLLFAKIMMRSTRKDLIKDNLNFKYSTAAV